MSQESTTSRSPLVGPAALRPARPLGAGVSSLELPEPVLDRLRDRAAAAYPEECCGLLIGAAVGDGLVVSREVACPNVAPPPERRTRFEIDARIVLNITSALRSTAEEIVGFYHSHPDVDAAPSETDLTYFRLWPEAAWLIVPIGAGASAEARAWWLPAGDAAEPLEARLHVRGQESGPKPCPE